MEAPRPQSSVTTALGLSCDWSLISLGKGYFNIQFVSMEEREAVWKKGSWAVKPGILRLQRWVPDFNPYKVRTSVAWVRIYELSIEYWHPSVIFGIARALGTPVKIDDLSLNGMFGHYVRVLVDIDLSLPLQDHVMLERQGHCCFVSLSYEWLPSFCPQCNVVGHSTTTCRKNKPPPASKGLDSDDVSRRGRSREVYREKPRQKGKDKMPVEGAPEIGVSGSGPSSLDTSNKFAALQTVDGDEEPGADLPAASCPVESTLQVPVNFEEAMPNSASAAPLSTEPGAV